MKCLSLIQPYAELVVLGKKTIELRKWNTKFRGEFLVHASKKIDMKACQRFKINPNNLVSGAIIGAANVYDVEKYESKEEFLSAGGKHLAAYEDFSTSKYGFMLKDFKKAKNPIKIKGSLNFFNVDDSIKASLQL